MRDRDFRLPADWDEPYSGSRLAAFDAEDAIVVQAAAAAEAPSVIDPARILLDRPDVLAAFYAEYFGPLNDRNSSAWVDRVGGSTPEDYARYWYEAHGRAEGYVQDAPPLSSPIEGGGADGGRTTYDGVPIATILADRPDVFRAFFTEYYGPGNDRNSDAWVQRVGGTTVEDYADYWYRAHGKASGYVPSSVKAPADDTASVAPDPRDAAFPFDPAGAPPARPLVVSYVDGHLVLTPATDAELAQGSLFGDLIF